MNYLPGMAPPADALAADGYCDHRETPRPLFALLDRDFGPFDVDVAATAKNALCPSFFTQADCALSRPWGPLPPEGRISRCFCNPPYPTEVLGAFARKALAEAVAGRASTLLLCPAGKSDQAWWHECVCGPGDGATAILYVQGRIDFWLDGRPVTDSRPDHASVLILWEVGQVEATIRWWNRHPAVGSYDQARGLTRALRWRDVR